VDWSHGQLVSQPSATLSVVAKAMVRSESVRARGPASIGGQDPGQSVPVKVLRRQSARSQKEATGSGAGRARKASPRGGQPQYACSDGRVTKEGSTVRTGSFLDVGKTMTVGAFSSESRRYQAQRSPKGQEQEQETRDLLQHGDTLPIYSTQRRPCPIARKVAKGAQRNDTFNCINDSNILEEVCRR